MPVSASEAPSTVTAAATSAASGMDAKAKGPALQTPVSASYPSELPSPHPGAPTYLKREDNVKTPVTPPSSYVDFLNKYSVAPLSPPNSSGSTNKFPSSDKASLAALATPTEGNTNSAPASTPNSRPASHSPPTASSQPVLSRHASTDSGTSISTMSSFSSTSTESIPATVTAEARIKPQSPRITIPPSQFVKPTSARTPRRLHIPQSPLSAASVRSPMSSRSMQSPYTTSALSATPWSATYSPRTIPPRPVEDKKPRGKNGKVSVRQVVTRTVTYCRTPLDPAPKGKRRKVEEADKEQEDADTKMEPTES